jgi:carbon-monoxide dehydrogenase large subunit
MPEGIAEGIGASVRRKEDKKYTTGKGRYTDDINRAGQLYAFFMRSNVAHATIKKIDVSKALTCDGVAAIYTGDDIAADGVGGPICGWTPTNRDGSAPKEPPHPLLAHSKVRYVGDHIAVVIAESLEQARSAAEKITVDLTFCRRLSIYPPPLATPRSMMKWTTMSILTGNWETSRQPQAHSNRQQKLLNLQ